MIFKIINRFGAKWLVYSFAAKAISFIVLAILFKKNWPSDLVVGNIFISAADTGTYYSPIENLVDHGVYNSYCRMPGLLPIYAPLYLLFGCVKAKVLVILIQYVFSAISLYLLCALMQNVFCTRKAFYYTFIVSTVFLFNSIYDHYGLSDSLGVSFLIISCFYFSEWKYTKKNILLFISGVFLCGSVFLRPVHIIVSPILFILIFDRTINVFNILKSTCILFSMLFFALSFWIISNFIKYDKFVLLQGEISECFGTYTPEYLSIRKLIILWGDDYQPWSKETSAEWFLNNRKYSDSNFKFDKSYFTDYYNNDSLLLLRDNFYKFRYYNLDSNERKIYSYKIMTSANNFADSYLKNYPFKSYFFNRLKIAGKCLFPSRLDDFPAPVFAKMNYFEKLLKGSTYVVLFIIDFTGLIGIIFLVVRKVFWVLIPLTFIFVLFIFLGCCEQRYLAPIMPFFVGFSFAIPYFILQNKQTN